MFRASDIFGRKPGAGPDRPTVQAKAASGLSQKRLHGSGTTSQTWDPATGQWVEEELPDEVKALLGIQKKVKVEVTGAGAHQAWGEPRTVANKVLGPASIGLKPTAAGKDSIVSGRGTGLVGQVDKSGPSVVYKGFSKVDLNDRYYERGDLTIHGRLTYWSGDGQFFIYWQGEVQRWSICDAASLPAVKQGQYPGWAYKKDSRHLFDANGWMEAWNGEWREPDLEVTFRSSSHHKPQWDDPKLQKGIVTVEFSGFTIKELNTRYILKPSEPIQGKPSYWDASGVYFIYWQAQTNRWAICDLKCLEAVRQGQCPGWAYRTDAGHFANACNWKERRVNSWGDAVLETSVIGVSCRGLKVELYGFNKQELNTQYTERPSEEVQGKPTYWDSSENYFIYWQSSMGRWAICDKISLDIAKSGLAPGWAYRTDAAHFARARGWMESWGREWKHVTVTCTLLEGVVREEVVMAVKAEPATETAANSDQISVDQYRSLIMRIYEEKKPEKVKTVDHLLAKYKDREHELYVQVCDKYQVDADAFAAQLPQAEEAAKAPDDEAADEGGEVPELTPKEYAILIQSVYVKYNPKKLQDIGRLLQKFRNRERQLYQEVCNKYGVSPTRFWAEQQKEAEERPED